MNEERDQRIVARYLAGESIGLLGREHELSRQRIFQIVCYNAGVYRRRLPGGRKKSGENLRPPPIRGSLRLPTRSETPRRREQKRS